MIKIQDILVKNKWLVGPDLNLTKTLFNNRANESSEKWVKLMKEDCVVESDIVDNNISKKSKNVTNHETNSRKLNKGNK